MLLRVLNISSKCHKTLKRTKKVGQGLDEVAKKSCDDGVAIEKESSRYYKLSSISHL